MSPSHPVRSANMIASKSELESRETRALTAASARIIELSLANHHHAISSVSRLLQS